ncbi:valine--tRNA ligase [Hujiaoplasma nucleasis]|uniref:Valine--tRNA ligase n=1 Tax=Hujiaoplasma nucleasis TaxID=2725268 RepID=A0A7L6N241_9MOLU|nr:valine--tRNA ligase [Hujiaoplasma nucleasis]QLY39641.1 valine--tRNA ligase [Hujiaoplasma nucleasis]
MDKLYNPKQVEKGKYDFWLKNKLFSSGDLSKKPFTIVIPPPNVTGKLHIGHTWDNTLQDLIIRLKRMQGYDALYLPGMDHAGIATQAKVDQKLREQGINRYELGREKYLEHAWKWKEEYSEYIREQWKTMGLSLDYSKERFTLDEGLSKAVNKVFIDLYNKGLIYQGERIIHWDVEAKTALSNIEIDHKEVEGALYYIKYKLVDSDDHLVIATTRPETMFGDSALMVHPEDERFLNLHGKEVFIPTTQRKIKIITDDYVDKDFGTGIVKVTPAHDPNDFEVGRRHDLEMPLCMNEDGTMNHLAHKYEGMHRFECRKVLVSDMQEANLIDKIEKIIHNVGHSERTNVIVEPRLSKQWFVKMDVLAKQALDKSIVEFIPERFKKIFVNWMEGIEDWCISRQLWWGHRIPVWYKNDEIYVGEQGPKEAGWKQDEDVLDTWFSSALWPFSTLGWPNETDDLKRYYPNDLMVTGHDIIFFWVSRMIFQAIEFTGESPFKQCLMHGLIRDDQGRKMSKSLDNGVDPIDVVNQYGIDALRYFITTNSAPGLDLRYEEEKVESSWNFINKLWNISRYVIMNTQDLEDESLEINAFELNFADQWILTKLNTMIQSTQGFFDRYEFNEAARLIYNFTWNDFASWYIEMAKISDDLSTKKVLIYVLDKIIKLLHPFMPFVTEEIYQQLPQHGLSIMIAKWPEPTDLHYEDTMSKEWFFELIKRVRNVRNEYHVSWSKPIDLMIKTSKENEKFISENRHYINKFLNPSSILINQENNELDQSVAIILADIQVHIPLGSLVNIEEEITRIENEIKALAGEIKRCQGMLNNSNFMNKAPQSKIDEEKEKLSSYQEQYSEAKKRLAELSD